MLLNLQSQVNALCMCMGGHACVYIYLHMLADMLYEFNQ